MTFRRDRIFNNNFNQDMPWEFATGRRTPETETLHAALYPTNGIASICQAIDGRASSGLPTSQALVPVTGGKRGVRPVKHRDFHKELSLLLLYVPCAWCRLLAVNRTLKFEVCLRLRRPQRHSQALILDEKLAYALFKTSQSALPFLLSELRLLHLRTCGALTDRIQRRFLILLYGHNISRTGSPLAFKVDFKNDRNPDIARHELWW